ncbi:MAG: ABC transporter substrate-binding protein, partial [Pseudomonadota bacterium]
DPAIDRAIEALVSTKTSEGLIAAARTIDRLLLAGDYMVPLFHTPEQWIARWTTLQRPVTSSWYGSPVETWWSTDAR